MKITAVILATMIVFVAARPIQDRSERLTAHEALPEAQALRGTGRRSSRSKTSNSGYSTPFTITPNSSFSSSSSTKSTESAWTDSSSRTRQQDNRNTSDLASDTSDDELQFQMDDIYKRSVVGKMRTNKRAIDKRGTLARMIKERYYATVSPSRRREKGYT